MQERPKGSAFFLIAVAFFCIYLVKTGFFFFKPSPRAAAFPVESSSHLPTSAGARLVLGLPIDINIATAREFELLPGIGPVLAERIIEARRQSSGFSSTSELEQVKGLSPARVKALTGYIKAQG